MGNGPDEPARGAPDEEPDTQPVPPPGMPWPTADAPPVHAQPGQPPEYPPPPGYQPPAGYPPPPYYAVPPQTRTNGFAIASMVLGILWIWWIGSILALVFGYMAKARIDRSNGLETGRGMAIAGLVLGWIGVGFLILFIILVMVGASSASY